MENRTNDYSHIKGWGVDADPKNEPTYPMKKYTGDDHKRLNWERPPLQEPTVEVLKSNERPNLSAVIGTSTPPSGLSGMLRRYAFTYSESAYGHWLPLILADKINVVEGIIEDLGKGHIPNIFAEKGWGWEWKHNRAAFTQKLVIGAAITAGVIVLLSSRKKLRRG